MNPFLVLWLLAMQQPTPQPPTTTAPAPARRAAPAPVTLEIRVTDRSGAPLIAANVSAVGPSVRDGTTDARGIMTFTAMVPGMYRVRGEAEGFITFERELTLKAGNPMTTELALSPAATPPTPPAPPPPAPPPAPPPPAATGARGEPHVLSIPDLAERSLGGREPVKVLPIACTGVTTSRLIVLRESLPLSTREDADDTIYLVAGEATLTVEEKTQAITAGWLSVIPRSTRFGIARKGRNPAILLSTLYGPPCDTANAGAKPEGVSDR